MNWKDHSSIKRGLMATLFELPHDKTNKMACAPSEDSDQPGHPPSPIRVFAVCMKKHWVLSYPLSTQQRLIRLGRCSGWSESSLGKQSFCWFCYEAAHIFIYRFVWVTSFCTTAFYTSLALFPSRICRVTNSKIHGSLCNVLPCQNEDTLSNIYLHTAYLKPMKQMSVFGDKG